ncbi:MAG: helix-turn-helix transcriptional regulator [Nostoc sp. NOS(2021)]|uniref:helix-turn-helix transcriptional regulator n=1 Tax=Nostoc sp. NOS(2021) TaxID=2815407 RepID=UPI0025E81299|nr:helix-turn-helix transcriptional regulator [Nostoc sp. NOS(2021)]MBN3893806.1 helix-turn-helix transcriptional regulator [Nostoc sp. NOS(2021)]
MPLKPKSRVASLREKVGLTQVQLAVLVGVTPNTIQNWEKENGLEQLERYLKLAEVFGCNVSDLVEYVPAPEEEAKSKGFSFSLEDLRKMREGRETGTKAQTTEPQSKPKF